WLLVSIPVMFATGLLSYAAYNPDLSPVNDETPGKGVLGFYLFSWPTHPIWLYRLNQGVHVTLGLVLVPILLFKLWSVLPKLFEWPPRRRARRSGSFPGDRPPSLARTRPEPPEAGSRAPVAPAAPTISRRGV